MGTFGTLVYETYGVKSSENVREMRKDVNELEK